MKQKCITITENFVYHDLIREYWDWYSNPKRKITSYHLGGDFHKEIKVKIGKERVIGSPIGIGERLNKSAEEGYHYVDAARICDIENMINLNDVVFLTERDGFVENVNFPHDYLKSFDKSMVVSILHIQKLA